MLPKITDRSETYSSHLQRLIKIQSLRTALYGNRVCSTGEPWGKAVLASPTPQEQTDDAAR